MKLSLQLKLGQQLAMTPQLQQAIKLLQLSTLDLQQEIHQALESNPMLELIEGIEEDENQATNTDADTESASQAADSPDNKTPDNPDEEYWQSEIPKDLESSIFRNLTVEENVLAILQARQELTREEREKKLEQLLEEFSIVHIRNSKGMSLSGGERRRTEIARTMATDPKFILLDEPFAGVDPISVSDIKTIINQLKERGIGILLTDHNVRETLDICEKAYIVSEGRLIADGDPSAILSNEKVRSVYLGSQFKI